MKLSLLVTIFALVRSSLAGHLVSPKFPGYGFSWYDPVCGFACYNAISGAPLSCSDSGVTSPECFASNMPFLTTLAYCMNSTCDPMKIPTWQREKFWSMHITGDMAVEPHLDYSRTLEKLREPPTVEFNSSSKSPLNQTVLVGKATYEMQSKFMIMFDHLEMLHARYAYLVPDLYPLNSVTDGDIASFFSRLDLGRQSSLPFLPASLS